MILYKRRGREKRRRGRAGGRGRREGEEVGRGRREEERGKREWESWRGGDWKGECVYGWSGRGLRSPAMGFSVQNFPQGFPKKHSNTLHIKHSYSAEGVLSQATESCLCKSSSPFTMGHYGRHYVIHLALIAVTNDLPKASVLRMKPIKRNYIYYLVLIALVLSSSVLLRSL